jgi:AcrR family transcriptional regulator
MKKKKSRKDTIFDAAVKCFNEKGYYETSIDAIAAEAKISKGGIYYHFKSKKELFLKLYSNRVDKYFKQIKELIRELNDPEEQLRMFINNSIHILKKNEDFFKFCIEFLSMGVREPEIRNVLTFFYKDSVATFSQIIEEGIKTGKFHDHDTGKTARALYLLFMGVLFTNFSVNVDFDIITQNTFQLNTIINSLKIV